MIVEALSVDAEADGLLDNSDPIESQHSARVSLALKPTLSSTSGPYEVL